MYNCSSSSSNNISNGSSNNSNNNNNSNAEPAPTRRVPSRRLKRYMAA